MAGIRSSLSRLRQLREQFEKRLNVATGKAALGQAVLATRLRELANFGSNPGNLRMHVYVPDGVDQSPPLVVALHGCTQTANSFDQGTGWSHLADRLGFILLFPEQQPANNPKNCFSWFLPGDTARDRGEALSIRQMIAQAVESFGVDESQVFVTGLSAGGAMTSVMLATYPEVFAGGAIIAGLPYGAASSVQEAFEAMFNERAPSSRALGDQVRAASNHRGPWPKISVWHGTGDTIVRASNADHIIRQWVDVHKIPEPSAREQRIGPHARRIWQDSNGNTRLEAYSVTGMAHGVPLATDGCGLAGPFFLQAGISSTRLITQFWGLDRAGAREQPQPAVAHVVAGSSPVLAGSMVPLETLRAHNEDSPQGSGFPADPAAVIQAAFKAAGLPVPERTGGRIDSASIISAALKAAGLRRS
jgi:poly(hydroxyalkanoate) depolymerase family esterase